MLRSPGCPVCRYPSGNPDLKRHTSKTQHLDGPQALSLHPTRKQSARHSVLEPRAARLRTPIRLTALSFYSDPRPYWLPSPPAGIILPAAEAAIRADSQESFSKPGLAFSALRCCALHALYFDVSLLAKLFPLLPLSGGVSASL